MQIPPLDLGRVEVIKGVASSLYGAGAMGGVVNLVSRRPGEAGAPAAVQSIDARRHGVGLWYSAPLTGHWGLTLLASGNGQQRTTSTVTTGPISRSTSARSFGRGCSGTTTRAGRSSRRRAARGRIGPAARCRARCWRRPACRTSRRSTPGARTPAWRSRRVGERRHVERARLVDLAARITVR